MANPNNAFGTNAAFGGRTSPNAFNDVLASFQGRGILSGWACSPDTGMTITLGGDGTTRDVAIAEDNAGNKTTIDNIPASPISVTIAAAPATQSRIDAVVVYVENPPQGSSTATDNYGTVGVLDVQGTTAATPTAPNDSDIRTAITADGASGTTAYYVVLAYVTVASGITTITSAEIEAGPSASLQSELTNIPDGSITGTKIAASTVTSSNLDWSTKSLLSTLQVTPNITTVSSNNTSFSLVVAYQIGNLLFANVKATFTSDINIGANGIVDLGRITFDGFNMRGGICTGVTSSHPIIAFINEGTGWTIGFRIFANSDSSTSLSQGSSCDLNIIAIIG